MESTKITLPNVLPFIQKPPENEIRVFFNTTGQLETFFTYKGNLIDIYKEKLRIDMGKKTLNEYGEELRALLIKFLQYGYTIIFNFGGSETFDLIEFLKQFNWFKEDFFENMNYLSREYLIKNKILKDEEDWDLTNTFQGEWKVRESARLHFLSELSEDKIEKFFSANSKIPLKSVIVG
jgi:hypothetical protein